MKLAMVNSTVRGEIDRLLSETAAYLQAEGAQLSGVVKVLDENAAPDHTCDMDLIVLPDGPTIRITQSLGEGSTSCRLNPAAIVEAVGAVEQKDASAADMFILNKFGPQESEGRGFRGAISTALENGIPVLVGVGNPCRDAFDTFAGGMADVLPADEQVIRDWCRDAMGKNPR